MNTEILVIEDDDLVRQGIVDILELKGWNAVAAKSCSEALVRIRGEEYMLYVLDMKLPEEIRRIREKYGLSQVAFAKVLGLGNKTVARYENGSIADMAQNNLIELMKQPSNFRELLQKNQDKISKQDYENAMNNLETLRVKVTFSYTTDSNMVYNLRPNSPNRPEFWGDRYYA